MYVLWMGACLCHGLYMRSEDNFGGSVLSYYHVGPLGSNSGLVADIFIDKAISLAQAGIALIHSLCN